MIAEGAACDLIETSYLPGPRQFANNRLDRKALMLRLNMGPDHFLLSLARQAVNSEWISKFKVLRIPKEKRNVKTSTEFFFNRMFSFHSIGFFTARLGIPNHLHLEFFRRRSAI
jgi:hypothetical protein